MELGSSYYFCSGRGSYRLLFNKVKHENKWICKRCGRSTFDVDYDYLTAPDEHLECALIHDKKSEQKNTKQQRRTGSLGDR